MRFSIAEGGSGVVVSEADTGRRVARGKEVAAMANEVKIGTVSHFFGKIMVAAIELTDGDLSVGDTIHIKGHTSDFNLTVDSMQIEGETVEKAAEGESVGIRVPDHAREGDEVFLVED
jgi:translation initiation factor IF-2